ncbi:hypothetical protein FNH05_03530 [Amycolatopsis rhizosphaerae]|uniref:EthD domain-containing protein n=1 Tax=Amycolatopsis rhizosphaerae TaxID=2053003 RepID=A0A558DJG6_9PSEU|nr:hypothetical protein [Amycolatopsis rhizosphaerae]TVT61155.1 hypothetical protein FNH05_03530 [Amycolatopsis rhizosphaerae]
MTSSLLLVTEIPVEPSAVADAVAVLRQHGADVLHQSVEHSSLLELTPLPALNALSARMDRQRELRKPLAALLTGDFRSQVLEFVGAPKPVDGELPETPYLQLRHVEVKPPVHEEYLAWREGTIFAEVRKSPRIEAFLAYHSLLSTEPGVLFIAGFSCEPEEYLPTFASERYAEIARQAHPRFVTDEGLYTRIYRRVAA